MSQKIGSGVYTKQWPKMLDHYSLASYGDKHMAGAVHLVCPKGKYSHCGAAYRNDGLPVSVYNLEVYRRHIYRVGVIGLLVHNNCDWRSTLGVKNLDELENHQIGDITNRHVKSRIEYSSTRELAINGFMTDQSNRINKNKGSA